MAALKANDFQALREALSHGRRIRKYLAAIPWQDFEDSVQNTLLWYYVSDKIEHVYDNVAYSCITYIHSQIRGCGIVRQRRLRNLKNKEVARHQAIAKHNDEKRHDLSHVMELISCLDDRLKLAILYYLRIPAPTAWNNSTVRSDLMRRAIRLLRLRWGGPRKPYPKGDGQAALPVKGQFDPNGPNLSLD